MAAAYERHVEIDSIFGGDDRRKRYGFWQLFRAASIRGIRMTAGDLSFDNRFALADDYVQLSAVMLDHEEEGDQIVLVGDLLFAEQCVTSAYNLIRDDDPPLLQRPRRMAERRLDEIARLREGVAARPDEFVLRPRYGPFTTRRVSGVDRRSP